MKCHFTRPGNFSASRLNIVYFATVAILRSKKAFDTRINERMSVLHRPLAGAIRRAARGAGCACTLVRGGGLTEPIGPIEPIRAVDRCEFASIGNANSRSRRIQPRLSNANSRSIDANSRSIDATVSVDASSLAENTVIISPTALRVGNYDVSRDRILKAFPFIQVEDNRCDGSAGA